jgi:flavin reductase (DIM6/NTAB) family NADH-FMN oxidoreductase RutF
MDSRQLKAVLDRLDTTPCVVTSAFEGRRDGCLISFITRCSIKPPRLLVLTSHETLTNRLVEASKLLAVHPVARGQEPLVSLFGGESGREVDKFQDLDWKPGQTGTPVLRDVLGFVEGRVVSSMDCGDHTARLVEPIAAGLRDPDAVPLTIFELMGSGLLPPSVALGDPWKAFKQEGSDGSS